MRGNGRWSQWVDLRPEQIQALKVNGKWQFQQQTMLLLGTSPAWPITSPQVYGRSIRDVHPR